VLTGFNPGLDNASQAVCKNLVMLWREFQFPLPRSHLMVIRPFRKNLPLEGKTFPNVRGHYPIRVQGV